MKPDKHKIVRKSFRISEEEEVALRKQCERYGMNDSEYLRFLLGQNGSKGEESIRPKGEYLAIRELMTEVNRIGTNINQIVKNVNMHYYSDYEKKKLFAMMEEVRRKVMEL